MHCAFAGTVLIDVYFYPLGKINISLKPARKGSYGTPLNRWCA